MKIARQKSNRTKMIAISTIAAAILVVVGILYWQLVLRSDNANTQSNEPDSAESIDYSPPTEEEKQEVDKHKEELAQKEDKGQPPANNDITVTLTRVSQLQNGQPLNVRTIVSGATSGECRIALTKNGEPTVTKTFDIVFEATSAHCNGNIAMSEFSASGDWALTLVAKSGDKSSAPIKQTVTIKK